MTRSTVFLKLLSFVFLCFLISCGGNDSQPAQDPESHSTVNTSEEVEEADDIEEEEIEEEVEIEIPVDMSNKGIGPISSVELGPINESLAKEGAEVFKIQCTACHRVEKKLIGPALVGVTTRRAPEWIMNMILNPSEMTAKDSIASKLMRKHERQMDDQGITEDQARALLEFFRLNDKS